MDHGRAALACSAPDDTSVRAAATALLGLASWRQGDLDAAETAYAESMRRLGLAGHVADVLGCAITLADLQITQGRLRDAERTYRDALELAGRQPGAPLRGHAGHARRAQRDRRRARRSATRPGSSCGSRHELGDHLGMPQIPAPVADRRGAAPRGRRRPDRRPRAARRGRARCTTATSRPTSSRSRPCGPGCWVRQGRPDLALAWAAAARAVGGRRARPTSASTST